MPKAILKQGQIVPIEALPPDWGEGTTLELAKAETPALDIDVWAGEMQRLCADSVDEDEALMQRLIDEQRQRAKADVRREMG